jgi:hypothetical protein
LHEEVSGRCCVVPAGCRLFFRDTRRDVALDGGLRSELPGGEAGETRFLLVQPTPDGNVQLLELSPADGRRLVRQGQHMQEML